MIGKRLFAFLVLLSCGIAQHGLSDVLAESFRGMSASWTPTQDAGKQAWITLDRGGAPYRVAQHLVIDSNENVVTAYAILDENNQLISLNRRDYENLAWALELSVSATMMNGQLSLDQLLILEEQYELVLREHHRISYWTDVQERAIQLGVLGVGAYFGNLNTIIAAAPSLLHNEITNELSNAPKAMGKLFLSANLLAEQEILQTQISWLRDRLQTGRGSRPERPLSLKELREAYARDIRIISFLQPSAEYLVALQDDASTWGQVMRLIGRGGGTALALAPGATATQIGDLIAGGNLIEAMERTVDGFLDFRAEQQARHASVISGKKGDGQGLPAEAAHWVILNEVSIEIGDDIIVTRGRIGSEPEQTIPATLAPTVQRYRVSAQAFSVSRGFESLPDKVFGPGFSLARWEDVRARYQREGGAFLRAAGMARRGQEGGVSSAAVSVNGRHARSGGSRYNFIAWGNVPNSFLVHDKVEHHGVPLNLGSWYTDQHLLVLGPSSADTSLPVEKTEDLALFRCKTANRKQIELSRQADMLVYRFVDLASGRPEITLSEPATQIEIDSHVRGASVRFRNGPGTAYVVSESFGSANFDPGASVTVLQNGTEIVNIPCTTLDDLGAIMDFVNGQTATRGVTPTVATGMMLVPHDRTPAGSPKGLRMVRLNDGPLHMVAHWENVAEGFRTHGAAFLQQIGLSPQGGNAIVSAPQAPPSELVPMIMWGGNPAQYVRYESLYLDGAEPLFLIADTAANAPILVLAQPVSGQSEQRMNIAELLNVRAGQSTSHAVHGQLPLGEDVAILQLSEGWAKLGDRQWVSERFLVPRGRHRTFVGTGETSIDGYHTDLTLRVLLDDRNFVTAIIVIKLDGAEPQTYPMRDLVSQASDEIVLRSPANAQGIVRTLKVHGDCLGSIRNDRLPYTIVGCELSGILAEGRREYRVGR